jgi:biopolymer transport protein TolR
MRRKKSNNLISEMNVVPYIDVMLVLLIIFMVTAPMITQGIKIELPVASSSPVDIQTKNLPLIISIDKAGLIHLDESGISKAFSLRELVISIKAKQVINKSKTKVLIRGDASVKYGSIVKIMATLKKNGIQDVGLITQDE